MQLLERATVKNIRREKVHWRRHDEKRPLCTGDSAQPLHQILATGVTRWNEGHENNTDNEGGNGDDDGKDDAVENSLPSASMHQLCALLKCRGVVYGRGEGRIGFRNGGKEGSDGEVRRMWGICDGYDGISVG